MESCNLSRNESNVRCARLYKETNFFIERYKRAFKQMKRCTMFTEGKPLYHKDATFPQINTLFHKIIIKATSEFFVGYFQSNSFPLRDGLQQKLHRAVSSGDSLSSSFPSPQDDGVWAWVTIHPNNWGAGESWFRPMTSMCFNISCILCFGKRSDGQNWFLVFLLLRDQSLFHPGIWPARPW